ncbi:peptidoglycan-recognition protein LB-like [Cydia pomonella]|uniref:peptidoglycan-recognition protein LB-like n=1 Tax=Cydia pomonella TaxID=82600 RepID=UPI002ADDF430|nr:peptidoglycan-recognition protein LB-like [Cydia pomonella]
MAGYIVVCLFGCQHFEFATKPATSVDRLSLPVPYVTINYTYIPAACFTAEHCKSAMRDIQTYHQDDQKWSDIGYKLFCCNFAIGSDGVVYEGRGWFAVGAHAYGVNSRNIGIVFIGDYIYKY